MCRGRTDPDKRIGQDGFMVRRPRWSDSDQFLQTTDEAFELIDDGLDRRGFAEVHASTFQERHRVIAAARREKLEIPVPRAVAIGRRAFGYLSRELRRRRKTGGVLIDVIRRVIEMRDARPG